MHAAQVMMIERGDMRGVSDVIGSSMSSAILVRSECYKTCSVKDLISHHDDPPQKGEARTVEIR